MNKVKLMFSILFLFCFTQASVSHILPEIPEYLKISTYLKIGRNLLVGDPKYTKVLHMPFDPYQSDYLKGYYQKQYGFRGERLVHALGAGYSIAELKRYGAA